MASVLTSIGYEYSHPLVKGFSTPNTPRKEMIPMDTLAYVAVAGLAFISNITATILIEKLKKKGLIVCETERYK